MKQKIIIVVLVLVIVGIGWFVFSQLTNPTLTSTQTATSTTTTPVVTGSVTVVKTQSTPVKPTGPTGIAGNTYHSLITIAGNYECLYVQVTSSSQTTNTLYISDGRLRGEFRTNGMGGNLVVYDGQYLYTWKEGSAVGIRTQPKTIADLPALIPQDMTSATVLGSGLNSAGWDCHPWIRDASILVAPSNVKFTVQ